MVTLSGSGLTEDMTITHDNGSCVIINATQTSVVCQMMPGVSSLSISVTDPFIRCMKYYVYYNKS